MSLFTKLLKKSILDFLQKWRKGLIALVIFIFVLFGLNIIISHYVNTVFGSLIREFVNEKSDGFYEVDFDEVRYIVNGGSFIINNFRFTIHRELKEKIVYEDLAQNYIYNATIPKMQIKIINFLSIFVQRKLNVVGVEIDAPIIQIINLNKDKKPKIISFEAGTLYEALSGYLNELKINNFKIIAGEFDYKTYQGADYDNFILKGVNFEVRNFQIDEHAATRTDKFFYTDDISLEIQDQLFNLKDSIHQVRFDQFYISTRKNQLGFKNFVLTRRENPLKNKKTNDHYEITLPDLRLSGIDFINAYHNNRLLIDSIQILDPSVNIVKRTRGDMSDSVRNSLLDITMMYDDFLYINNFNLNEANFTYTDETTPASKKYSIDHISAFVSKIQIDTGLYSKRKYGFDFEEVDLVVQDYAMSTPDSLSTIKFDEFSISSSPSIIKMKNLKIEPGAKADTLSGQNMFYANIPYLVISEFDLPKAINSDTISIDELYFENPQFNYVASSKDQSEKLKLQTGGLFGTYKLLQSFSNQFILNKLIVKEGDFLFQNHSTNSLPKVKINQFDLNLQNIIIDKKTATDLSFFGTASLSLNLTHSKVNLPSFSISLGTLNYTSIGKRLKLRDFEMANDTTTNNQDMDIRVPEIIMTSIDLDQILLDSIYHLDTLKFKNGSLFLLAQESQKSGDKPKRISAFPKIKINHLIGENNMADVRPAKSPIFKAQDINFNITGFVMDQSLSEKLKDQFDFEKLDMLSVKNYTLYLTEQRHFFESTDISWDNTNGSFSMKNSYLTPFGKPSGNSFIIRAPSIVMDGIDIKKLLKSSYYESSSIHVDSPDIRLKLSEGKKEKITDLDLGFIPILMRNNFHGIKAKSIMLNNASISIHQKTKGDSLFFETDRLDLSATNFELDSNSTVVPERFLFADNVVLDGDYLSAFQPGKSNFYTINHYRFSTKDGDAGLNGIYIATNTKNDQPEKDKLKITVANLFLKSIDFYKLTQNQTFDVEEIQIGSADVQLTKGIIGDESEINSEGFYGFPTDNVTQDKSNRNEKSRSKENRKKALKLNAEYLTDSIPSDDLTNEPPGQSSAKGTKKIEGYDITKNDFLFDTLLLERIHIKRLLITDSKGSYENDTKFTIPNLWLLAENINYDPVSAKDASRIFFSDNLVAKIANFSYVTPDNLSSISMDELELNSKDSSITVNNFILTPRVSRYDYGPARGFQSTWMQMKNESIILDKVDFLNIINKGALSANSLKIYNPEISVFRDKRIPFPEWQRRPLPQTTLRELGFTLNIDTINLFNGYINYQEHPEKAYSTGEVFFTDLNATILNLTNDSIRTLRYSKTNIEASANVFGKGKVKAAFLFDLKNMDNIHTYGIELDSMDLSEFNRILIPSASVQIASGQNNKIIMNARANETYSYGEMKFYYDDLKIQLLNRETETPKGLGNALGSFFANTFIIKTNNPRNFFLRKGDIFFERDEKRAIFNYWTKTFLSGVVSSIGAANNKKKYHKMQAEDLKKTTQEISE